MVYYMFIKIRITPCECLGNLSMDEILDKICKRYAVIGGRTCFTFGIEKHNKFGEEIKEHLHFHAFIGDKELSSITVGAHQKWFRETLHCKGNKSYYVKLLGDVKEYKKFFQYPLKQKQKYNNQTGISSNYGWLDNSLNYCKFPKNDKNYEWPWEWDYIDLIQTAGGDYERTVEMNVKTRERMENKSMFFMKLVKHLKEKHGSLKMPHKTYWIDIVKFYIDNGKSPPFASLDDKINHIKIELGHMTYEEAYARLSIGE